MKATFYLYIIFLFPFFTYGQIMMVDTGSIKNYDSVSYARSDFNTEDMADYILDKKLKVRVEVGTVFGSGNYFGTYIAPNISYRMSPRFTLNTRVSVKNNFGGTYYEPYSGNQYPMSAFTSSLIYVEGAYQVNKNLIVSGAVYKEFNMFSTPNHGQPDINNDYEGMIMGVDYKIGENMYIRGQVEISNGRNPYRSNPFANPAFGRSPHPFNSFDDPF